MTHPLLFGRTILHFFCKGQFSTTLGWQRVVICNPFLAEIDELHREEYLV